MGLDMYMNKRVYVKKWSHDDESKQFHITIKKNGKPVDKAIIDTDKISEVIIEVAYWRKANAIHRWFVQNVQNGVDDCGEHSVSLAQLKELLLACRTVSEDHTQAGEILPTESGFFFGSTDFDEYYFEDIASTINIIEGIIEESKVDGASSDYYYSSSW